MPEDDLSTFLSGTRRDLPGFFPAARDALAAALPHFQIRMMEDAEPEDIPGDHWSRREATQPTVLIGLIGKYYGFTPRGQDRSLSEQEYDTAHQMGIDRLMFVTDVCDERLLTGQSPQAAERITAFRSKIDADVVRRGVLTPVEFAEHAVIAVKQWERRTLRGATQSVQTFYAPVLQSDLLFSHTEPLVGQATTLAALQAFVASIKRVLILHAPWGRGKSRLLLEFAGRCATPVRFVRGDTILTRQALEISGVDPMVLVIEDLGHHEQDEVRPLLEFLRRCSADVKLVVAARSTVHEEFQALIRSVGIPMDAVEIRELPALTDSEQRLLVAQVLGGESELAHQVASETRGSALAGLLAARLIRRGHATFQELSENPNFVAEVIGRFQDALLDLPRLDASTQERLKKLLHVVALCAPLRPANSAQREALASFLRQEPEDVSSDLATLEDLGLLMRRGGLVTIPVQAIRDAEALRACLTSRGERTGLAERALQDLTGEFRGNLLRNLARVEWSSNDGTPSFLEGVWADVASVYDGLPASGRMSLLRDLEGVAPYQPEDAIRFVRHAYPTGLGPPEVDETRLAFGPLPIEYLYDRMAVLLVPALYRPECVREACDLLWQMAKDDERLPRHYRESAERALIEMGTLDAHRPLGCYETFLDWLEAGLLDKTVPGLRLIGYVTPLLAKELERGYSDADGMHFWAEGVPIDKLLPLHDRALHLLGQLARDADLRIAAAAVGSIGKALRPPSGAFRRKIKPVELAAWEPSELAIVDQLRAIADERDDRVIDLRVLHAVDGMARHSVQPALKEHAAALVSELLIRLGNTVELALTPHWVPPWDHRDGSEEVHRQTVEATAKFLIANNQTNSELIASIGRVYNTLEHARIDCHAWTLLNELTKLRSGFGVAFMEAMLGDDSPVASHADGALIVLLVQDSSQHGDLVDRAVAGGGRFLQYAMARGSLSETWRSAAGTSRFLAHCGQLLGSKDWLVRTETLRALHFAKEIPPEPRVGLLLKYDTSGDPPEAHGWPLAVESLYDHFSGPQHRELVTKLKGLPVLEFMAQKVLGYLATDEPAAVVDMLLERVRKVAEEIEGYEAVPDNAQHDCLAALPKQDRERGLIALALMLVSEDYFVSRAAQELFVALGGADREVQRRVRRAWALSKDPQQIQSAAQSFRQEDPLVLFDEEDVIVAILRAAAACSIEINRDARVEMLSAFSNGGRTGRPSDPDSLDSKIRDRAQETASRYPAGTPERTFYEELTVQAQSMIDGITAHLDESTLDR